MRTRAMPVAISSPRLLEGQESRFAIGRNRRQRLRRGDGRSACVASLVALRGRDADGRLRALEARRSAARPVLGALAVALLDGKHFEALGYRCVGDWSRERIGVGARVVREWARAWRGLEELPCLRSAVLSGDVSWTVARRALRHVTQENEVVCVEALRGRTVRAAGAIAAAFEAAHGEADDEIASESEPSQDDRVAVRVGASPRIAAKWAEAVELARRWAGEALPVWACAEAVAAEGASAWGVGESGDSDLAAGSAAVRLAPVNREEGARRVRSTGAGDEHGLRAVAWPHLRWRAPRPAADAFLVESTRELDACDARELDARFRRVMAFLQDVDFEIGRLLRQLLERRLYRELGFASFERYVTERLDLSGRTARRMVALARAEHRAPPVAAAFREGRVHALQGHALVRAAEGEPDPEAQARWVAHAERVTLRRLEDDVDAKPRAAIAFTAPREVAELFVAMVARAGGVEALLDHAIATWREAGRAFKDYADFERDGWRCTVPGCTARRNLQSHHIWFRSHRGPDVPWNRTTLCACHHQRGVHEGRLALAIEGRAPDGLIYALGTEQGERYRSGDVRM